MPSSGKSAATKKCKCGAVLVVGVNWSPGRAKRGTKQCRKCASAASTAWKRANPRKARAAAKRSRLTVKGRYARAVGDAKRRGKGWSLSFDRFCELIVKPCVYCGRTIRGGGVALDRIRNSDGYHDGNVVPACRDCNVTRNCTYTHEEMLQFIGPAIRAVHERRAGCSGPTAFSASP